MARCDWLTYYWGMINVCLPRRTFIISYRKSIIMKYGLWSGISGPKIVCAMTRSQTWPDVTSVRNRTIWCSACMDDVMMSTLRSCSAFNCIGPVGEAARGGDLTSFLKDECEALWPKLLWTCGQSDPGRRPDKLLERWMWNSRTEMCLVNDAVPPFPHKNKWDWLWCLTDQWVYMKFTAWKWY
jgi:hypothetical protein